MCLTQSFGIWCLLMAESHFFTAALETCRTVWFDDGDVTYEGDSELLADLRRNHWNQTCSEPLDMEVQTVSGIRAEHSRNTFHRYNASEGFECLHSEQETERCDDYKVMFTCTGQFCSGCRTRWFDYDDPTENGDYEVLEDLLKVYPRDICPRPIAIEAQTVSGQPATSTGDRYLIYDATYGFACVNAVQASGACKDYRVRFTCPAEFCQVPEECRTAWLDSDDPTGEGDVESLSQLLNTLPGQACRAPLGIQAQTTAGISANFTGNQYLSYDVVFGFVCINVEQRSRTCEDYQVLLTCPADFCQGCRTRWFDLDDPSGHGDYETLAQLRMQNPSEVCWRPLAVEAMTVSGVPALRSGDTIQAYDATYGFACVNAEQPEGSRCQDYKVRFTCPLDFCSVTQQ